MRESQLTKYEIKWTILGALQRLHFAITIDWGAILRLDTHSKRAEISALHFDPLINFQHVDRANRTQAAPEASIFFPYPM